MNELFLPPGIPWISTVITTYPFFLRKKNEETKLWAILWYPIFTPEIFDTRTLLFWKLCPTYPFTLDTPLHIHWLIGTNLMFKKKQRTFWKICIILIYEISFNFNNKIISKKDLNQEYNGVHSKMSDLLLFSST